MGLILIFLKLYEFKTKNSVEFNIAQYFFFIFKQICNKVSLFFHEYPLDLRM